VDVGAAHLIFISGQTALDHAGDLVGRGDSAAQAEQVFENLGHALPSVGCTASDLVKLTVRPIAKRAIDFLPPSILRPRLPSL